MTNRAEIFMGTRKTIIYRLVSTNYGLGFIYHFRFLDPKKGRGSTLGPQNWGLKTGASKPDQKVDPLGGLFRSPVISKSCFQLFRPRTPPPPPPPPLSKMERSLVPTTSFNRYVTYCTFKFPHYATMQHPLSTAQ